MGFRTSQPVLLDVGFQDIIKFMLFATIAMAGFMVSLRNVFWWYCEMQNIAPGWRSDAPLRNGTNAATAFHK